jgi:hypothetical protein
MFARPRPVLSVGARRRAIAEDEVMAAAVASTLQPDASKGWFMNVQTSTHQAKPAPEGSHALRFASLFRPGRGVVVPCDARGIVDLDGLSERLRISYLAARAMIGREYAYPIVELVH